MTTVKNSSLLYDAARNNKLVDILYLLDKGVKGNESIALGAIKGGHINILNWVIKRFKYSYNNWDYLACCAAKEGQRSTVYKMIKMGAYDWDRIALAAYDNEHYHIVNDMIRLGADCFNHE